MQKSFNQFSKSLLDNIRPVVTFKKYEDSFIKNVRIWKW